MESAESTPPVSIRQHSPTHQHTEHRAPRGVKHPEGSGRSGMRWVLRLTAATVAVALAFYPPAAVRWSQLRPSPSLRHVSALGALGNGIEE